MSSEQSYTTADLLVTVMAREIEDGDLLTQGIGTHLPTCAGFLAKLTHAPSCQFLYSIGGSISDRIGPISLKHFVGLAMDRPVVRLDYTEMVCDILPTLPFKEFSRPAQVDRFGNTNNIVIGPYREPKLHLPGAGGIPDFSPYATHNSLLYVPRHDPNTFVEQLDFRSGVGRLEGQSEDERLAMGVTGAGARRVITDLGIIDFTSRGAVLAALHPGVESEALVEATGFEIEIPEHVERTAAPTEEELGQIREIDPYGVRELEFVSASKRFELIRSIAAAELQTASEVGK